MNIRERLITYIKEKTGAVPDEDTGFTESGLFDSMGFILFVSFIEHEFRIHIPEEDLTEANFHDLKKLLAYLESVLND